VVSWAFAAGLNPAATMLAATSAINGIRAMNRFMVSLHFVKSSSGAGDACIVSSLDPPRIFIQGHLHVRQSYARSLTSNIVEITGIAQRRKNRNQ
jgi:hypothetical protein